MQSNQAVLPQITSFSQDPMREAMSQKREEFRVEIRRRNLNDVFNRKRFKGSAGNCDEQQNEMQQTTAIQPEVARELGTKNMLTEQRLHTYAEQISKLFEPIELLGQPSTVALLKQIRTEMFPENHGNVQPYSAPFDYLFRTQLPALLVRLLDTKYYGYEAMQSETLWLIANISGCPKQYVPVLLRELKLTEKILPFLRLNRINVEDYDCVFYYLYNVLLDSTEERDHLVIVTDPHLVLYMFNVFYVQLSSNAKIRVSAMHAISVFFKRPFSELHAKKLEQAVHSIAAFATAENYRKVLSAPDAVSYQKALVKTFEMMLESVQIYMETNVLHISRLQERGIVRNLLQFFEFANTDNSLVDESLRLIGSIACGNDYQVDMLLLQSEGVEQALRIGLQSEQEAVRRTACWVISNLAAGSEKHGKWLLERGFLLEVAQRTVHEKTSVQRECTMAVCNVTNVLNDQQDLASIIDIGFIRALVLRLNEDLDFELLENILEALNNMFMRCKNLQQLQENIALTEFQQCGGESRLEVLLQHKNEEVSKMAQSIIDAFIVAPSSSAHVNISNYLKRFSVQNVTPQMQ